MTHVYPDCMARPSSIPSTARMACRTAVQVTPKLVDRYRSGHARLAQYNTPWSNT